MRRTTVILGMLLLGVGCASGADRERARELFRQLDANGDRQIQFSEIRAARERLFDRLDTNRNGILDADEARAAAERAQHREPGRMPPADLAARRAAMDRNGDGRITRDEFASFIPDRLLRADVNGDRVLSLRELRSLRRQ